MAVWATFLFSGVCFVHYMRTQHSSQTPDSSKPGTVKNSLDYGLHIEKDFKSIFKLDHDVVTSPIKSPSEMHTKTLS